MGCADPQQCPRVNEKTKWMEQLLLAQQPPPFASEYVVYDSDDQMGLPVSSAACKKKAMASSTLRTAVSKYIRHKLVRS